MKEFSEQRIGENGFIAKWQVGKEKNSQWKNTLMHNGLEKLLLMEKKHV